LKKRYHEKIEKIVRKETIKSRRKLLLIIQELHFSSTVTLAGGASQHRKKLQQVTKLKIIIAITKIYITQNYGAGLSNTIAQ